MYEVHILCWVQSYFFPLHNPWHIVALETNKNRTNMLYVFLFLLIAGLTITVIEIKVLSKIHYWSHHFV